MHRTAFAVVLAAGTLLAACGATESSPVAPEAGAVPTPGLPFTYEGPDGVSSTIESAARIVTLSGDFSEVVWDLGLGANLVGVDLSSDFPPEEMAALPKIGVEFRLFAEPILALEPTVVLGDVDATPPEVIQQVRDAGVPVVIMPRLVGVDAPAAKIRLVAQLLGLEDGGEELASAVQEEIDAAVARAGGVLDRPRAAVVYIATADQVLMLSDNTVFQGLLDAVGADDVGPTAGSDAFVPLTAEAIAAAAPDVIITARRGFENRGGLDGFLALPGIAQTPAGSSRRILVYEDSLLLSLGPRTGTLLARLVDDLHPELVSGAG